MSVNESLTEVMPQGVLATVHKITYGSGHGKVDIYMVLRPQQINCLFDVLRPTQPLKRPFKSTAHAQFL